MIRMYTDFSRSEYETRWDNAQSLMKQQKMDALLITEESNYIYFTGHRSDQNTSDKLRPYIFLLPCDRPPVLITMDWEHAELQTYVDDIRSSSLMGRVEILVKTFREYNLDRSRIGAELGREQYLGISYNEFQELVRALPRAVFLDASDILLTLRSVKSPAEVEYIRCAAEIAARAQAACLASIEEGMSEDDIAKAMRTEVMQRGGEYIAFLTVISGHDLTGGKVTRPTDRVIQKGDTVTPDLGVRFKGYCCDVCRTAFVGEPSDKQLKTYRLQRELSRKCFSQFRPGVTPHDVMQFCSDELDRLGEGRHDVGRIGHGVGINPAEYPSITLNENITMQEGMVFACNPNFELEHGFYNCEDNVLVTKDGFEILSEPGAPVDPPIIRTT